MRKGWLVSLAAASALVLAPTGCYRKAIVGEPVVMAPAGPVVVREAPPPLRVERMTVAPGNTHVWVPGFWTYRNQRWVWIPGHWEIPTAPARTYVPGTWKQTGDGWVFTPGRWQ